MKLQVLSVLSVALLAACNSQPAKDAAAGNGSEAALDAAGSESANSASDRLVYPGSQSSGDRFSTRDPIDRVVAWYWDPQHPMRSRNGQSWAVSKPEKRDTGYLVQLTVIGEDGHASPYAIYLAPGAGGGTDGRIRPITAEEMKSGVDL